MSLALTHLIGFGAKRAAGGTPARLNLSAATKIGNCTGSGGLAAAFDASSNESPYVATGSCARAGTNPGWCGVDHGSGVTRIITRFKLFSPNNSTMSAGNGSTVDIALYGSNSNPANSTDGTSLYSATGVSVPAANGSYEVTSGITTTTAYRYHWIRFAVAETAFSEIHFDGY